MALCSACVQLARTLSTYSEGKISMVHSAEVTNILKSATECRLCKFLISCIGTPIYISANLNTSTTVEEQLNSGSEYCGPLKCTIFQQAYCHFSYDSASSFYLLFWADDGIPSSVSRFLHPKSDPMQIINFISLWLKDCLADHGECTTTISSSYINESVDPHLPSRVLDLGHGGATRCIRLLETNGTCGRYCALSHCWGRPEKPPIRTMRNTREDHIRGIEIKKLPKTFQDAIAVTQGIGIRYLWIDSLCIVQDDKEDWIKEARGMGKLYERAVLTIAASGAHDSHEGLFISKSRDLSSELVPFFLDDHCTMPSGSLSLHQVFDSSPAWGPLKKRGWVFQEWRLSRRIVHFTEGGVSWKCKSYECDQYGGLIDMGEYPRWDSLLRDYCDAKFTLNEDRLIALRGLATEMQVGREDDYYYGMWTADLPEQLLWMRNGSFADGLPDVPSWTWAAKLGPRIFWSTQLSESYIRRGIDSKAISIEESGMMTIRNVYLKRCRIFENTVSHDSQWYLKDIETILTAFFEDGDKNTSQIYALEPLSNTPFGMAILDGPPSPEMHCLFVMKTEVKDLGSECTEMLSDEEHPFYWFLVIRSAIVAPHAGTSFSRVGMGISLSGPEHGGWSQFPAIHIL